MRTTRSRGQGSTIDNWNWNIWQQRLAFKCTLNTILITWCSWFTNIIKRRSCTQLWMRASSLDLTWIYPLVQKGFTQQQTSEHAMKKIQAKRTELVKLEENKWKNRSMGNSLLSPGLQVIRCMSIPISVTRCLLALWIIFNIACEEGYEQGKSWSVLLILCLKETKPVTYELN